MDDAPTNVKDFFQVNNSDEIDALISQLSAKEKAELVQKLLEDVWEVPIYTFLLINFNEKIGLVALSSRWSRLFLSTQNYFSDILLGQSGLMVVMGGSNVTTSELVIQIHSTSSLDLSELLRAVATRIAQPKDTPANSQPNNGNGEGQEN